MKRLLLALLFVVSAGHALLIADEMIQPVDPQLGRAVDFYRDVYPILEAKCLACHNASVKESDFVLESAASIAQGGASGEAIIPGQPDESLLYGVASRESEPVMPPLPNSVQAKPLTPRELGILRKWLEEGAKGGVRQVEANLDWQAIPESYGTVYSLALFPDERFLAAGRGNRVFVYDLVRGREVARLTDPLLQALQQEGEPVYGPGVAHRDFVHALAVSPDGTLLASGGYRVVKLWQRQPPVRVADIKLPASVRLTNVDAEGRWAAFVLQSNEVRLWNLANGSAGAVIPPSDWSVSGVAFSPDGESVITAGESGRVRLWSIDDGRFIEELSTSESITALAIWDEGPQLLTAHSDNVIRAWPLPDDWRQPIEEPVREFRGHDRPATSLVVLNDRGELVSSGGDRSVRIWNLIDGTQVSHHQGDTAIASIGVGADGERIVVAGENGTAQLVSRKGERLAEIKGNQQLAREIKFRTDELAVARQQFKAADSAVKAAEQDLKELEEALKKAQQERDGAEQAIPPAREEFDAARRKAEKTQAKRVETPGDADAKKAAKQADHGQDKAMLALEKAKAALVAAERAVELAAESVQTRRDSLKQLRGDRETAEPRRKQADEVLQRAREKWNKSNHVIQSVVTTSGGEMFLTAGNDQPVQLWKAETGEPAGIVDLPAATPTRVLETSTGALLTVDAEGGAALWDVSPRWVLAAVLGPDSQSPLDVGRSAIADRVTALAFSPDGTLLATGGGEPSRGGELMLWNVEERTLSREIAGAHSDTVFSIDFSRDGRQLATGGADRFVRLLHVEDGLLVRSFEGHTDHVLDVAFKADGSTLASGGADKAIKIWNIETGALQRTIENTAQEVTSLDFVGIGDNLVSSGGDKHVTFHRAANGKTVRTFSGSRDYLYAALATAENGLVIAAGADGVVRIWNAENGDLIAFFEPPRPTTETARSPE